MFLLILLRYAVMLVIAAVVLTQILIPVLTGTVLFPMFRKAREELLDEEKEVKAKLEDVELATNVLSLKKKLAEKQAALIEPKSKDDGSL